MKARHLRGFRASYTCSQSSRTFFFFLHKSIFFRLRFGLPNCVFHSWNNSVAIVTLLQAGQTGIRVLFSAGTFFSFLQRLGQHRFRWLEGKRMGRTNPGREIAVVTKFCTVCLMFVDTPYGTCFVSPFWHLKF